MLLLRSTFSLFSNIPSITYQGLATTQHYIYKSSHNIRVNFTSMAEQHLYVASHVRRLGYFVNKDKSLTKKQVHTNSLKYRMDIHFQTWCQNVPKLSNVLLQCMKEALLNLCARSCSLVYDIVLHFLTLATYRNGSHTKLSRTCMKSNPLDCRGK